MKRYLIYAFAGLLLSACGKGEIPPPAGTDNGASEGAIRFRIGITPQQDAPQAEAQTRVATDTKFRSTWEEGDAIGIFAWTKTDTPACVLDNVKLTYSSADGGKWSGPAFWPRVDSGIGKLDFYAYYPYDENLTDPEKIAFEVPTDQSKAIAGSPAYNRNDRMMARADNNGAGFQRSETVELIFSHALAMVQVNVSRSMLGDYAPEALVVLLNGCATDSELNLLEQTAAEPSGTPPAEKIRMYPCPNDDTPGIFAYRALVPAQTIAAGTALFTFEHDGGTLLRSSPLAQELPLVAGRAETFDLSFPFTSVTVSDKVRLNDVLDTDLASITHLKVLGQMTSDDFGDLHGLPDLTILDLGGATVKDGTIPQAAFLGKDGLREFVFPQGITTIGPTAFVNCKGLAGPLVIPEGVKTIGNQAFERCAGLTALTLPVGLETIGNQAFAECRFIGTLTLPEGLKTIGDQAFQIFDVFDLPEYTGALTIPSTVTKIGGGAFSGLRPSTITCRIADPSRVVYGEWNFLDSSTQVLYVPAEAVEAYKSHPAWSQFGEKIQPIVQP